MNVLVTGATKGIGRAIAEVFAREGAALTICARSRDELEDCRMSLAGMHKAEVLALPCDASKKEEVIDFANKVKEHWHRLDVLVNNAGAFIPGNVTEEEDDALEKMIETNLYSAYHLTRALLELMVPHRSGHIFNMSSVAALQAYPNGGSYSISKFALRGLSKALREELKEHNIKVTTLNMGAVYTPSWEGVELPKSRFADPEDVASLVYDIYKLSERTVVEEVLLRPMLGDI